MGGRILRSKICMKRSFSDMSGSSMDWASSSAGVRKPPLRRMARMSKRGGRRTALTRNQRMEVQRLVQRSSELKYFAFNSGVTTPISAAMSISAAPFQVPQGVTDSTRIGDELTMVAVRFRFEILNSLGALSDAFNNFRVCIFQWKPNSVPAAVDVFIPGPSGAPDIWSNYGHDFRSQFTILYDETFKTVGNQLAATTPGTAITTTGVQERKISLKFALKKVHYAAGGVTAGNLLYLALVTDSSVVPHPTITYQMKMFFRDA